MRWIFLPPGRQITTGDPDKWTFPVGTQFFKEFRKPDPRQVGSPELKVETRHLMKARLGVGIEAWEIATYAWQPDQKDAVKSTGEPDVLETRHNIPSREDCITCHKGSVDVVLGFDAIQLSDLQAEYAFGHGPGRTADQLSLRSLIDSKLLTVPLEQPSLPGSPLVQKVLGYLHSNCGSCHNPLGHAAEREAEHLIFRHKLSFRSAEATDVYDTAVNRPTRNFTNVPYIVMGAKHEEMALYKSALFLRMNSINEDYRMPMIGRQQVDYGALELMHQWLLSLPTPEDYNFRFDESKDPPVDLAHPGPRVTQDLPDEPGLHIQLQFASAKDVPAVMIAYWPEDTRLRLEPTMDQKNGYFTRKLIVGSQGSIINLLNSDDVGHTIYVKDKPQGVNWQLNYMPPGSGFEQELFWGSDTFVEMRCRLHLYMSSWVGSISTRFYKIVDFSAGEMLKQITMSGVPDEFSELRIWMPRTKPIKTRIGIGETKQIDLGSGSQILLKRVAEE